MPCSTVLMTQKVPNATRHVQAWVTFSLRENAVICITIENHGASIRLAKARRILDSNASSFTKTRNLIELSGIEANRALEKLACSRVITLELVTSKAYSHHTTKLQQLTKSKHPCCWKAKRWKGAAETKTIMTCKHSCRQPEISAATTKALLREASKASCRRSTRPQQAMFGRLLEPRFASSRPSSRVCGHVLMPLPPACLWHPSNLICTWDYTQTHPPETPSGCCVTQSTLCYSVTKCCERFAHTSKPAVPHLNLEVGKFEGIYSSDQ
eukprot:2757890-Amphidinium_carterae.3